MGTFRKTVREFYSGEFMKTKGLHQYYKDVFSTDVFMVGEKRYLSYPYPIIIAGLLILRFASYLPKWIIGRIKL